jgi:hypothetical protein
MRPLKITPGYAITDLALSPDGRQLGVVQDPHGFRLFDTVTGAEVGRDADTRAYSHPSSGGPAPRVKRPLLRLAEVAAGRRAPRFQSGWKRSGTLIIPEPRPDPFGFPRVVRLEVGCWWLPGSPHPGLRNVVVHDCTLSTDHRLAVGTLAVRRNERHFSAVRRNEWHFSVLDLAEESILVEVLHTEKKSDPVRWAFVRGNSAVVAATKEALLVFEIPASPGAPVKDPNSVAPVVAPAVAIPLTQPQPARGPAPFAVLPGGHRVLVRGEKSRVELRELATGEVLTEWRWGLPRTTALAVAADGLTAAAGGTSGRVVLWDLE